MYAGILILRDEKAQYSRACPTPISNDSKKWKLP